MYNGNQRRSARPLEATSPTQTRITAQPSHRISKKSAAQGSSLLIEIENQILEDFGYCSKRKQLVYQPCFDHSINEERLQTIFQVLSREHHERSQVDLKDVTKIVKSIRFFNEIVLKDEYLNDQDFNDLSRHLTYEHFEAGDYICQQGEKSSKMYVLLRGQAGLFKSNHPAGNSSFSNMVWSRDSQMLSEKSPLLSPLQQESETAQTDGEQKNTLKVHPMHDEIKELEQMLTTFYSPQHSLNSSTGYKDKLNEQIESANNITQSERNFKEKLAMVQQSRIRVIQNQTIQTNDESQKKSSPLVKSQKTVFVTFQLEVTNPSNAGSSRSSIHEQESSDEDVKNNIKLPEGDHLCDFNVGNYFGQLALHQQASYKIRQSTVFAKTPCDVLVITNANFKQLLEYNRKRREQVLLTELKLLPLLSSLQQSHLKKIVNYFYPVKMIMHQYLYKENQPATHVYIVKKGEFRSTIRMSFPNQKKAVEADEVYKDPKKAQKGANSYFIKNSAKIYETVELQVIGSNQFIGEEDCAANDFYHTTVQCISQDATLLAMTREDFRKMESFAGHWQLILSFVKQKILANNSKMIATMKSKGFISDKMVAKEKQKSKGQAYIAGEDLVKQRDLFHMQSEKESRRQSALQSHCSPPHSPVHQDEKFQSPSNSSIVTSQCGLQQPLLSELTSANNTIMNGTFSPDKTITMNNLIAQTLQRQNTARRQSYKQKITKKSLPSILMPSSYRPIACTQKYLTPKNLINVTSELVVNLQNKKMTPMTPMTPKSTKEILQLQRPITQPGMERQLLLRNLNELQHDYVASQNKSELLSPFRQSVKSVRPQSQAPRLQIKHNLI